MKREIVDMTLSDSSAGSDPDVITIDSDQSTSSKGSTVVDSDQSTSSRGSTVVDSDQSTSSTRSKRSSSSSGTRKQPEVFDFTGDSDPSTSRRSSKRSPTSTRTRKRPSFKSIRSRSQPCDVAESLDAIMELPVSDDNRDVHTIFEDLPRVSYKNILRPKINHILGFYVEEFKRLLSGTWLQENTINNYFKLLQKETMQMLFLPTPHLNEGADFMERSMRDVDKYGAYPKLFLPLNINGSHWILYVIDNQSRTIKTLDSLSKKMKSNKKVCAESLAQIVAYYAANGYNITDYALQTGDICPQQPDYSNCGVCVILNAQFMLDGGRLNYPHKKRDFIIYRQAIACSLLTGTLM